MEVIKHGNTVKEHTCSKCGCTFIYGIKDIHSKRDYGGFQDWSSDISYILCPECDHKFYIAVVVNGEDITDKWNK